MTLLVTGGSGFLGSHLCEQLSRAGRPVRALVRRSSNVSFLKTLANVELVEGAVDDRESFLRAAEGITGLIHSAGLVKARSPREFHEVNVGGTENALAAAAAAGPGLRRFILISSLAAAGPSDAQGSPVRVGHETPPVTHYGRSKLAAERAVLAQKERIPSVIVRPPAIYGPRDQEFLAVFKAIQGRVMPMMGSAESRLSIIYGADCASAVIAALDAEVPSGSTYFVDDGQAHTLRELAAAFEGALGVRAWLRVPLPRRFVESVALASELYGRLRGQAQMLTRDKCNELFNQWVCDAGPAREQLGWSPSTSLEEGARRTVEYYRSVGAL